METLEMEDCDELWRVEKIVLILLILAERLAGATLALGEVRSHLRPVNTHSPPPISKMRWKLAALRHVSLGLHNNFKIQSVHIKIQIYSFISF